MSKNLIIDYLSRIEGQLDELKGLAGKFDTDHVVNIDTIRQQKAKTAAEISNDVVNISGSKYIRDENRIIISAPEIILGNVDKNGNLIASDGSSRVVLRANNVDLEGVGKDDGSIGSVTARASRISQIAVDPGIDGMENVVASTSEILSVAKGIELRSDRGSHCVERDLNVPVQKGLHFYSPSDIEIASSSSCKNRVSELTSRQTVIADGIREVSEQLANTDLSITSIMDKIRTLADSEVYDVDRFTMSFSYTEIDAANRKLESYLIALLREFNKFFHLHSRLFELEREDAVISSELEELEEQTLPPLSGLNISVPVMRLKSEDGDGNFCQNGKILLRTHTLLASGKGSSDEELSHGTNMKIRFNKVNIDTSHYTFDESTNKHKYTAGGQIRLNSKHVLMESVNTERTKGTSEKERDLCKGGHITLNAKNMDISSLNKDGESVGEVNVNAKHINIVSHNVDTDGKIAETPNSRIAMYANIIKVGKVNAEDEKSVYSKSVHIDGENVRIQTNALNTFVYENIKESEESHTGHFKLASGKGFRLSSKEPIEMYVDGKKKVGIESDAMTVWPDFKALTSISDVPSIAVDNLEVKKAFKSPSTEEGMAVNSPAPNAPSEPQEEDEETPQVLITKEPLESRVEAKKALAECKEKEEDYEAKQLEVTAKYEEKEKVKKEKKDVEKELSIAKAKHIPEQEMQEIKTRLDQKKEELRTAREALSAAKSQAKTAKEAWDNASKEAVEAAIKADEDEEEARNNS